MSTRRRNSSNSGISKTLRDYLVPIIGLLLVALLVYSIFTDGSDNELQNTIKYENQIPLDISLDSDSTEAYIIYPGENKVKMESDKQLYKGEKVLIKEGGLSINFSSIGNFKLNKLGELAYLENGELLLNSSDMFINASSDLTINMKFAKILIGKNSTVSISQNEMSSNIYLLSGNVEVKNLVGNSTVLAKGQVLSISRLDASDKDVDLSMNKEEIDDFFKMSDWYIRNNGAFYLSQSDEEEEKTKTGSALVNQTSGKLVIFDSLSDESYVSSNIIDISGKYFDENITSLKLNNIEAELNSQEKTFVFKDISVAKNENDLVFKVYDDSNDLLQKFIYVVYYKSGDENAPGVFQVINYNLDGTKFTFTEPSTSGFFTTNSTFITIKGKINIEGVEQVSINDYVLSSYNKSIGTWRYHADVKYNNLRDGTNIYNVKYYDGNGKLIYANNYTIVKKPIVVKSKVLENKKIELFSNEASIN